MSQQNLNAILAQRLAAGFDETGPIAATFGHFCRSSSFSGHGHEEWVEAIQTKPGQWKLFKVSLHDDMPGHDMAAQRIEINGRFGFFDVLSRLAEYEFSYSTKGSDYVCAEGPDALGIDHYVAFGQREGIAFDIHTGKPLKTLRGHIVESGTVNAMTMRELRIAWGHKEMAFLPAAKGMCPNFGPAVSEKALDCLCTSIEDCDKIGEIQKKFEALVTQFVDMAKSAGTDTTLVHNKAETVRNDIDKTFDIVPEVALRLHQYVTVIELYATLYAARDSFANNYRQGNNANLVRNDIMTRAAKVRDFYRQLGGEPVTLEQIATDILRMNSRDTYTKATEMPGAISDIRNALAGMVERTNEIRTKLRVIALGRKDFENLVSGHMSNTVGAEMAERFASRPKP